MKSIAMTLAIFFSLALITPVWAAGNDPGDLCDPKKIEQCKTNIDTLLKAVEDLRSKLQKTQLEINSGRKLTNAEADRLLKDIEAANQSFPKTKGFMQDF